MRFRIITDHSALHWLMNITDPTGRLARWAVYLQAYNFEIIHRRGSNHCNVDALSRPVLLLEVNTINATVDNFKSLDPWEDEHLLHYLEYRKHIDGASHKQVKRVLARAPHYKLEKNILYYKKNSDSEYVEIPKIEERMSIMAQAHNFGHFQLESTYDRIKEKFYWKGIVKDIDKFIQSCLTCQRNQKIFPYSHQAIAIPVEGIFDRVGLDLVLGLPETNEGYNGILVITEYLSKFPYAVAIKSKSAEEISKHLFTYISLFGPPKIILSDQGKEFNNEVVENLLKVSGVDHKVTSAYNPRTNGEVERFNKTLIDCLRKHAETNPKDWPLWLPFVLLAYRSRIHSVTNFTPYELMFGRKINAFYNWANAEGANDAIMINQRANEIRNLISSKHEVAKINIKENQIKQKEIQNKRSKLLNEELSAGTRVFIKCEGLRNKLDAKYSGPFIVIKSTENHNYILKDVLGNELPMSYPLHKLKIVDAGTYPNDEIDEVKEILNHKVQNKENWYLVSWRNDSTPSWIPESNFNTMEIIQEYHNKRNKPEVQTTAKNPKANPRANQTVSAKAAPKKRGRRRLIDKALISILFFVLLLRSCFGFEVSDNFTYCNLQGNLDYVEVDDICKKLSLPENGGQLVPMENKEIYVAQMLHYKISGRGFQCKKNRLLRITSESIFFEKSTSLKVEHVHLSEEDCWYMVKTKKCGDFEMICNGEICEFEGEPLESYSWASTTTTHNYSCQVVPRYIATQNYDDLLFGALCKTSENHCNLFDSIVVWRSSEIVHYCPFTIIAETNISMIYGKVDRYIDPKNNWLFSPTGKHILCNECNLLFFETGEGLYILFKKQNQKLSCVARNITESKAITEILLAESDYTTYRSFRELTELNYQICLHYMSMVNMFRLFDDRYLRLPDLRGNNAILYTKSGSIFIPQCTKIDKIIVHENNKFCYRDTPISFTHQNQTVNAFLTTEGIIRKTSKIIECNGDTQIILLKNTPNYFIKRIDKITSKESTKNFNYKKVKLNVYEIHRINMFHSKILIEGYDPVENFQKIMTTNELSGEFKVLPSPEIQKELNNKKIIQEAEKKLGTTIKRVLAGLTLIISLLITIIIIFFLFKCTNIITSLIRCCSCCKKHKNLNDASITLNLTAQTQTREQNRLLDETTITNNLEETIYTAATNLQNNQKPENVIQKRRDTLSRSFFNLLSKVKSTPALNSENTIKMSDLKNNEDLNSSNILNNLNKTRNFTDS